MCVQYETSYETTNYIVFLLLCKLPTFKLPSCESVVHQYGQQYSHSVITSNTLVDITVPRMTYIVLSGTLNPTILDITVWTVVHTVLTATSQSNGNGQNSTLTESKPLNRLR